MQALYIYTTPASACACPIDAVTMLLVRAHFLACVERDTAASGHVRPDSPPNPATDGNNGRGVGHVRLPTRGPKVSNSVMQPVITACYYTSTRYGGRQGRH